MILFRRRGRVISDVFVKKIDMEKGFARIIDTSVNHAKIVIVRSSFRTRDKKAQ